jgi:hypothetical protein
MSEREGGMIMDEKEKRQEKPEQEVPEKEKVPEGMDFCTKAPSAEHARGSDEEEPCYDYREGK